MTRTAIDCGQRLDLDAAAAYGFIVPLKRQIAEIFVSHAEQAPASEFDDEQLESLSAAINSAIESARKRYSSELDEVSYARWLATRSLIDESVKLPAHTEDIYLACACASGVTSAIAAFDREVLEQTRPVLRRLGCSESEQDDVLQEVREKLLVGTQSSDGKLSQYQGTGPLLGWVRAVAGRQALAARRRRKPNETLDPDVLDLTDDPHLGALKQRYRNEFRSAFRAAVAALSEDDRALLADVVIREIPVGEIAERHGVHRVTASRWLAKIRQTLLTDTRSRLAETLDLVSDDIDSVIRLIDSQLDISLYSALVD